MRVAVTGASGFVGKAACAALAARGCEVRALDRRGRDLPGVAQVVRGTLADDEAVRRLVTEVDAVVHAAALVRSRDVDALRRTNIDGVRTVVEAAASVPRLVLLSTAGVHGRPGGHVDERSPFAPPDAYERSKVAAEQVVAAGRARGTIVLRPTNVIGSSHPFDPLVRFLRAVRDGRVWSTARAWSNYVGVDAVASAIAAAALSTDAPDKVIINDGRSVRDLAATCAGLLGFPDRWHELPAAAASLIERPARVLSPRSSTARRVRALVDDTCLTTCHRDWLEANAVGSTLSATLLEMVEAYRARGLL